MKWDRIQHLTFRPLTLRHPTLYTYDSWLAVKSHLINGYIYYPEWEVENKAIDRKQRRRSIIAKAVKAAIFSTEPPSKFVVVLKPGVDDGVGSEGGIVCRSMAEAKDAFFSISR